LAVIAGIVPDISRSVSPLWTIKAATKFSTLSVDKILDKFWVVVAKPHSLALLVRSVNF